MAIPIVLRRSYLKLRNNGLCSGNVNTSYGSGRFSRYYSDNNDVINNAEFTNSTILIENGFNVHELPVVVRKIKDLAEVSEGAPTQVAPPSAPDTLDYHLIKAEFKLCTDLRDVFSLLSKCTKITPNIALGAMERIYDLEKIPTQTPGIGMDSSLDAPRTVHINLAKGAILDKLLKVVTKTEDTQTILNVLNSNSTFMEPYKHKFCDELLLRAIDNQLSIEQLCEFIMFLMENKTDAKYSDTIDKLWVGFIDKEHNINEHNIAIIFKVLPGFKVSKKTILSLLEQKLAELWYNVKVPGMQHILNTLIQEKYSSIQTFDVIGRWFYANLHALDEDTLLDIVTKFTRLNYTDDIVEKAVEKYMKLKGPKIQSQILTVGILNYCMQFQIRNESILEACCEYFINNGSQVPTSFLKSFIYPFGYLSYQPKNHEKFWKLAEEMLNEKFDSMTPDDISSIVLSSIYSGVYPLQLARRLFSAEYLVKIKNPETLRKLHLIDTALAIECTGYAGPFLPKDKWSKSMSLDRRVRNIIEKIKDSLLKVSSANKMSTAVLIPFLYADETYMIDVLLHPAGVETENFNWKLKSEKNENTAILIHLPDHFCSGNETLIGPQMLRKKHLKLLGIKVASVKYSVLSKCYISRNKSEMETYLIECIRNAEHCN